MLRRYRIVFFGLKKDTRKILDQDYYENSFLDGYNSSLTEKLSIEYGQHGNQPFPYVKLSIKYPLYHTLLLTLGGLVLMISMVFLIKSVLHFRQNYDFPDLYDFKAYLSKDYIKDVVKSIWFPTTTGFLGIGIFILGYVRRDNYTWDSWYRFKEKLLPILKNDLETQFVADYKEGRLSQPTTDISWYRNIKTNTGVILAIPILSAGLYVFGIYQILVDIFPSGYLLLELTWLKTHPIYTQIFFFGTSLISVSIILLPGVKSQYIKIDENLLVAQNLKEIHTSSVPIHYYRDQLQNVSPRSVVSILNLLSLGLFFLTIICYIIFWVVLLNPHIANAQLMMYPNQSAILIKIRTLSPFLYAHVFVLLSIISYVRKLLQIRSLDKPIKEEKTKFFDSLYETYNCLPPMVKERINLNIRVRFSKTKPLPALHKSYIGRRTFLIMSREIFTSLNGTQLSFLISHELGHIYRKDSFISRLNSKIISPFGPGFNSISFDKDKNELLGDYLSGMYLKKKGVKNPDSEFRFLNSLIFMKALSLVKPRKPEMRDKSKLRFYSFSKLLAFYRKWLSNDYYYKHPSQAIRKKTVIRGYNSGERLLNSYI